MSAAASLSLPFEPLDSGTAHFCPLPECFFIGTAAWATPSWRGVFYPGRIPASELLTWYARRFRSVEVDATWYHAPDERTVDGWNEKTPDGFLFSAKVPQEITHTRILQDVEHEMGAFVEVMRRLGPKLGPLLLQFPHFNARVFPSLDSFLERLAPFLDSLPRDLRIAVEVRNRSWLREELFAVLRERGAAVAWVDLPWMPTARQYGGLPGAITADFLYVRWIGDRRRIEARTKTWDRVVWDRSREIGVWVETLREAMPRVREIYGFFNNHYSGCAFASAAEFEAAWERGDQTLLATS